MISPHRSKSSPPPTPRPSQTSGKRAIFLTNSADPRAKPLAAGARPYKRPPGPVHQYDCMIWLFTLATAIPPKAKPSTPQTEARLLRSGTGPLRAKRSELKHVCARAMTCLTTKQPVGFPTQCASRRACPRLRRPQFFQV